MTEALRPYQISSDDGILLLSLVLFAVYSFILYRGKDSFIHRWTMFFSNRKASGGETQQDSRSEMINHISLIVIWSISAGIVFCTNFSKIMDSAPYGTIFAIAGILFLYVFVKALVYSMINWTFFEWEEGVRWIASYFFLLSLSSLVLFPISMFKIFFGWTNNIAFICVVILLILYKILLFCKLYINFNHKHCGFLLLFLYFCTLEIMPVLIGWHIIS